MRAQPKASHWIGGPVEDSVGPAIESIYPASGEVIARIHGATPAVVEQAVTAARAAQPGWAALSGAERGAVLQRAAAILRDRNRDLSELETLDTGKALQETLVADAASGAEAMAYFGALAFDLTGEAMEFGSPAGGSFAYTRREPLGICVGIGAWNYPIQIACWKAAPALAAGNAMIFKPSETTPLSALKLAEILSEAGLPDGIFNVVQGAGDVGAALSGHPGIDKVSLTGSTGSGAKAMGSAAANVTPVTLELGGKSTLIVFDDADLDAAVGGAMLGNFYSTGQICSNGTRVFVQRGALDSFLERLHARTGNIVLGNPMDEATHLGPLVSRAQYDRVLGYIDTGKAEGARLVAGGSAADVATMPDGLFVQPTVFADVTDDMVIAREEIFGPVMSVLTFEDEAEVITRANDTETGLAAGVFTRDIQRAHRVIAALDAGTCWINTYNLTPAGLPFGGVKRSGFGRENARAAFDSVTRIKSVYVEMGGVDSPY